MVSLPVIQQPNSFSASSGSLTFNALLQTQMQTKPLKEPELVKADARRAAEPLADQFKKMGIEKDEYWKAVIVAAQSKALKTLKDRYRDEKRSIDSAYLEEEEKISKATLEDDTRDTSAVEKFIDRSDREYFQFLQDNWVKQRKNVYDSIDNTYEDADYDVAYPAALSNLKDPNYEKFWLASETGNVVDGNAYFAAYELKEELTGPFIPPVIRGPMIIKGNIPEKGQPEYAVVAPSGAAAKESDSKNPVTKKLDVLGSPPPLPRSHIKN